MTDNLRGAAFMMVAMAAFTMGDACMKALSALIPLYQAIALRGVITLVALVAIAQLTGGLRLGVLAGSWRIVLLRSGAELLATITFFFALVRLPLATLSAVLQAVPLALTLAAALFLREPVGWRRMTAIVVGFVGVLLIIRPGPEGFSPWVVLALISMAAVVVRDLASRRLPPAVPSVSVALCAAIGVTLAGAVGSMAQPWVPVTPQAGLLILAAAGLVIVGYVFVIRTMRLGEIAFTTQFRYTALVWAVALGWVVFGEWPDPLTLAGGAIVVGSGLFTLARERQIQRRATAASRQARP